MKVEGMCMKQMAHVLRYRVRNKVQGRCIKVQSTCTKVEGTDVKAEGTIVKVQGTIRKVEDTEVHVGHRCEREWHIYVRKS